MRHALRLALVTLLFSALLFSLDPLVKRFEGVRGAPPWEVAATKGGAHPPFRILPLWFTWETYATFWSHRLRGDVDFSLFPEPSQFMRSFGSLNEVARERRERSVALFWSAVTLGVAGGTALGLALVLWRNRRRAAGDWPLLDLPAFLPLVSLAALALVGLVQGAGYRLEWRPLESIAFLAHEKLLIYPALVLAAPLLPVIARFWLDPEPAAAPPRSPACWLHHGRAGLATLGRAMLVALGGLPVVEVAFAYPGMTEWAIRGIADVRVAQAGLQTVAVLGLIAYALGGRPTVLPRSTILPRPVVLRAFGAPAAPSPGRPSPVGGWLASLVEHDGFVLSGYGLALVAAVLTFAGFFPGMAPDDVNALQPNHPPAVAFPLGTDGVGRNIWRLMIEGCRVYLPVALAVTLAALAAAASLAWLAERRPRLAGAIRFGRGVLAVFPGIWWAVAVVLLTGRGLGWMALGLFLPALAATVGLFADSPGGAGSPTGPRAMAPAEGGLYWAGIGLVAGAMNLLVLAHLAFLGVGTRYPGPEVGTVLRDLFSRLEMDWVAVTSPALMVMAMVVALFLPGRLILERIDLRPREGEAGGDPGAG